MATTITTATADQFRDALGNVRDCLSSLTSARPNEVEREISHLKNAVSDLCRLGLKRRDEALVERRRELIQRSAEMIATKSQSETPAAV